MTFVRFLSVLVLAWFVALSAHAIEQRDTLLGDGMYMDFPEGENWEVASTENKDGYITVRFFPKGQSLKNWDRMFTAHLNIPKEGQRSSPAILASNMVRMVRGTLDKENKGQFMGPITLDDGYYYEWELPLDIKSYYAGQIEFGKAFTGPSGVYLYRFTARHPYPHKSYFMQWRDIMGSDQLTDTIDLDKTDY